jgi:hypothetical protein
MTAMMQRVIRVKNPNGVTPMPLAVASPFQLGMRIALKRRHGTVKPMPEQSKGYRIENRN